jgi:hypothetical protein
MSKFFSLSDINSQQAATDKSALAVSEFVNTHFQKIGHISELSKNLPNPGEAFFIWTVNQFNAFSFIPYLLSLVGSINNLTITTYSMNIKIIDALNSFLQQKNIDNVFILISDSAKFRIPKVVDHLNQFNEAYHNVTVRYAWNHSKVTLMNCGDDYFVLEGSGNFSENSRHEQYILINSKDIYEFRKKWIIDEIHGRSS